MQNESIPPIPSCVSGLFVSVSLSATTCAAITYSLGGAADMTNGGYAGTASRRDVIQKATNEELMSLLKRQSARLKSVEAEHGTLKEKVK